MNLISFNHDASGVIEYRGLCLNIDQGLRAAARPDERAGKFQVCVCVSLSLSFLSEML